MPRVLIVGCGYVGAATADLFHHEGWQVEGWTGSAASAEELSAKPYAVRAVDITDAQVASSAADGSVDAVIQCVSSRGGGAPAYRSIYFAGAQNLASAFPRSLLVFTSSTSVYAQTDGEWVTEQSAAEPLTETGEVLRETEELILARGGVVARLAGIYGPGRSALLRKFLAGEATIDGRAARFVNQAHRDDIAAALLLLAQHHVGAAVEEAHSRIFNVADGNPLTEQECYAWLANHLAQPLPPVTDSPAPRKRGNSNKRVSSQKLQALGWRPRYPTFGRAMRDSILPRLADLGA